MAKIEWALGIMLGLVALYLVLSAPQSLDTILRSLGSVGAQTFGTLQGRTVSGGGVTVGGSTLGR
jgi:hypothetical protein